MALAMLLLEPLGTLADNYERGDYSCIGFAHAEQLYRSEPENVYYQLSYAHCLIARGGQAQDALGILHNIADGDHRARVKAAWMIAKYIKTGGTLGDVIDENNISEAIQAYAKVVFLINLDPDYPIGNDLFEEESQIELVSHHLLPILYFKKYMKGAKGTDNVHIMRSPSYDGDMNLNTYPDYAPYTVNSLERMVEFADKCLALPMKPYFEPDQYERSLASCQILKEAATFLLPLERQRLVILSIDSCSNDLLKCVEHQDIKDQVVSVIVRSVDRINEIFDG